MTKVAFPLQLCHGQKRPHYLNHERQLGKPVCAKDRVPTPERHQSLLGGTGTETPWCLKACDMPITRMCHNALSFPPFGGILCFRIGLFEQSAQLGFLLL